MRRIENLTNDLGRQESWWRLMLPVAVLLVVSVVLCKPVEARDADAFARAATSRLLAHLEADDVRKAPPPEQQVLAFFRRIALADGAVVAEATSVGGPIVGPDGEDLGLRTVEFTTREVLFGRAPSGWTSKLATADHCTVEAPAKGARAFILIAGKGAEVDLVRSLPASFFEVSAEKVDLWGFAVPVPVLHQIIAAAHKEVTR